MEVSSTRLLQDAGPLSLDHNELWPKAARGSWISAAPSNLIALHSNKATSIMPIRANQAPPDL